MAQAITEEVPVPGGAVPVHVQGPETPSGSPALVVVPSIFGPAPDLLDQMATLSDASLTVVTDPFWRVGGGVVPYSDHDGAITRLKGFDREACFDDMRAVVGWARERGNGRVAGLGICFGGPVVLTLAGEGLLDGVVTWHGSRMEAYLDRASETRCPLRFHFGSADPVTPPDAIEKIRDAFAGHPDASFVVHEGLEHGFSHHGRAYDEAAALAGLEDARDLLTAT
ncbi:MAG: dienelactone hydrolase family protein [Myxococcota bacterium]